MKTTWTVWSLDVWGNPRDGFEVNDRSRCGVVELGKEPKDAEVIRALKAGGFLSDKARASNIEVGGDDLDITIDDKRSGRPLLSLELDPDAKWKAARW